jgi:hypothetical protein
MLAWKIPHESVVRSWTLAVQMNADPDDHVSKLSRQAVLGIMAGVALFGVLIAIGVTYRTGKLLALPVVLGVVGGFLSLWYSAWRKSGR